MLQRMERETDIAGAAPRICTFYQGDSVQVLGQLVNTQAGQVQLAYLDPPYATGHTYYFKQRVGEAGYRGDRSAVLSRPIYKDVALSDRELYVARMREVLRRVHCLLSETGCIFVQVDHRVNAQIRLLLNEIFGEQNFVNEIIWHYKSGGTAKNHFSRKHDTIYFFRKSDALYFDRQAVGEPRGKKNNSHLRRNVDQDGRTFFSINSNGKLYRYYEDALIYPSDVWSDIAHLQQRDPERTGFDSQKPLALLERVISACTRPGDVVMDPFCGSGTTLHAALKMKRVAVGIDESSLARDVCFKRLMPYSIQGGLCFRRAAGPIEFEPALRIGVAHRHGEAFFHMLDYTLPDSALPFRVQRNMDAQLNFGELLPSNVHEHRAGPEQGLGALGGAQWLDAWAAGVYHDGVFEVRAYFGRSFAHPELMGELCAGALPQQGRYAIATWDAFGQSSLYVLEEDEGER